MLVTMSVFIVDGNPDNWRLLQGLLDRIEGLSVAGIAASVPEGIEEATRLRPAIIVVDAQPHRQDWAPIVRSLAAVPGGPAVVLHVPFVDDEERQRLVEAGAAAIVLKGAGPRALLACLRGLRDDRTW